MDAVGAKADVFLTGELRFHDFLAAQAHGLSLVLPGHYATERFGIERSDTSPVGIPPTSNSRINHCTAWMKPGVFPTCQCPFVFEAKAGIDFFAEWSGIELDATHTTASQVFDAAFIQLV